MNCKDHAVSASVAALELALETMTTNEPINRREGNIQQADLEAANATDYRLAIDILREGRGHLPSRCKIGDIVLFQPDLSAVDVGRAGVIRAKVVGVRFTESKVLYDLALANSDEDCPWYDAIPVRDVDSVMVKPCGPSSVVG